MKKYLLVCVALITFLGAYARDVSAEAYFSTATLLNAVTATGAGEIKPLGIIPISGYTCTVTWGGTVPTNVVVDVEGSVDGVNFGTWSETTATASPTTWHIANKPALYIRGNYVSKSGGDPTTSVTLSCLGKGN